MKSTVFKNSLFSIVLYNAAVSVAFNAAWWNTARANQPSVAGSSNTNNTAAQLERTANESNIVKTSFRPDSAPAVKADRILLEKNARTLTLFANGEIIKEYQVSLGREPKGPKVKVGDNRTPEGLYFIDYRVKNSDFHRALHISYPNRDDILRAREMGVSPGGNIMLHGLKNGDKKIANLHGVFDWTNGCVAVTNSEIEEIWQLVPNGTPIYILP